MSRSYHAEYARIAMQILRSYQTELLLGTQGKPECAYDTLGEMIDDLIDDLERLRTKVGES